MDPTLTIFLIILGSGLAVTMGYGTHRLVVGFGNIPGPLPRSTEQDIYMREVRQRNLTQMERYGKKVWSQARTPNVEASHPR
jgi:hypothetical protein